MHSAPIEYVTLLSLLVKNCIKAEALCPAFKLEQTVLLVRYCHHVFIASCLLVLHHRAYSKGDFDPLSSDTCHQGVPIEGVHLRRHIGAVELKRLLMHHASLVRRGSV